MEKKRRKKLGKKGESPPPYEKRKSTHDQMNLKLFTVQLVQREQSISEESLRFIFLQYTKKQYTMGRQF